MKHSAHSMFVRTESLGVTWYWSCTCGAKSTEGTTTLLATELEIAAHVRGLIQEAAA